MIITNFKMCIRNFNLNYERVKIGSYLEQYITQYNKLIELGCSFLVCSSIIFLNKVVSLYPCFTICILLKFSGVLEFGMDIHVNIYCKSNNNHCLRVHRR